MTPDTLMIHRLNRMSLPPAGRAAFSSAADRFADELSGEAAARGEELVVLSTCERFEVYRTSGSRSVATRLRQWPAPEIGRFRVSAGAEAVRHLFRVASGLDSRIPGEAHVLGQVREAFHDATRSGTARRAMADVFAYAIRCAKRARRVAAFDTLTLGYASIAVARLRAELGGLEARRIAVVGSGMLATEVARDVMSARCALTLVGRHEARVRAVAHRLGADWLTLTALNTTPTRFDAVVTAVAASEPVITAATLAHCRTPLLIDLGAAPNVDPRVEALGGHRVLRLDDLHAGGFALNAVARAEAVVEQELRRYLTARSPIGEGWRPVPVRQAS